MVCFLWWCPIYLVDQFAARVHVPTKVSDSQFNLYISMIKFRYDFICVKKDNWQGLEFCGGQVAHPILSTVNVLKPGSGRGPNECHKAVPEGHGQVTEQYVKCYCKKYGTRIV